MDTILFELEQKNNVKDKLYFLDCQLGKIKVKLMKLLKKEQSK